MRKLTFLLTLIVLSSSASAQILELAEMNTRQIAALDRQKTVVLIPGGLMEQHGPYLPANADGYLSDWLTRRLAERLVERPGWTVVIFPTINIGSGSANVIGNRYTFPGSFDVRNSTLRDVFMDLASSLGEQGFRWIFPIHLHGYPGHNAALDQAGDYFHDIYGGRMIHLMGLMPIFDCCGAQQEKLLSEAQRKEEGFSVHSGAGEHSMVLFLRPDLVAADLRQAVSQTATDFPGLMRLATSEEWPGYFGAPRHASAALGAAHMQQMADVTAQIANRILDGLDPRELPRYADIMAQVPPIAAVVRGTEQHEDRIARQQREWLAKRDTKEKPADPGTGGD
ncbi:MAG TPA: creatininase family protein [Thermoanaerobaculia bacterium]